MRAPEVDVILPVLNEARALPWVLERVPAGFRPIVVDNGSTDGSADVAHAHGATVIEERRKGFGAACHAGLVTSNADVVCFMDCDGSLDPGDLPTIAGQVRAGVADLVLGRRLAEAGAWPPHARIGNRVVCRMLRARTGVGLGDIGPMRAARRGALLALGIRDRRFGWPLEMVMLAASAGWRIQEVPVPYRAREGRSKVTGTVSGTIRAISDMARALR